MYGANTHTGVEYVTESGIYGMRDLILYEPGFELRTSLEANTHK
jgi:hypothetical protein